MFAGQSKNRHLLGFDNPMKALMIAVKEMVDNSVEYSEPVLIKDKGEIKLVQIGEFIDKTIVKNGHKIEDGVESSKINNCEVLVYDDKTFKMSFKPASKVHRHKLRDKLFEIETVGGRKVTTTGSHSVFTLKDGKISSFPVKNLKIGNYIIVPRKGIELNNIKNIIDLREEIKRLPKNIKEKLVLHGIANKFNNIPRDWKRFDYIPYLYFEENKLEIPEETLLSVNKGRSKIPVIIKVTKDFMKLLGYYAAEGTCYDKWITFSFGSHEKELIEDTEKCLINVFGENINFNRIFAHPTAITVKVYSEPLSLIFKHILKTGSKSYNKNVPSLVFNVSNNLQKEFLSAYIAGDGYVRHGKITVATVSKELSVGLQYILSLNGIAYSILKKDICEREFPGGYKSKCRESYYLYIYGKTLSDNQYNSPLSRIPLDESGFREILLQLNPLISYNNPHYANYKRYKHFTIDGAISDLDEAIEYRRNGVGLKLKKNISLFKSLLLGDIGVLQIKNIKEVESEHSFVYDFSVPGSEKFVGGRGAIFLHNSLDACQESGILPELTIKIKELSDDRARVSVEDNGPGIVKEQIPRVFGKLLYGSKFYNMRQGRGQQGIGVSAALLYSQLTTGKPAIVISRTAKGKTAHEMHIRINTSKNEPEVIKDEKYEGNFNDHGTYVEMEMEGKYRKGDRSVDEFIKQTAIANPFAKFVYHVNGEKTTYSRIVEELPKPPKQIKPHPQGVEMGVFEKMTKMTKARSIAGFLSADFTRVSPGTAREILKLSKVNPNMKSENLTREEMEKVWRNLQKAKLMKPPMDCLSPIGESVLEKAVKKDLKVEYTAGITRSPDVYRGMPFQIEVCIGYGGNLNPAGTAQVMRFANRVPLLYQSSSCAITKAVQDIAWKSYHVEHSNNNPTGPLVIIVHMASVWIPYTSESKEAIDPYDEIEKEIKLAIQDCARKLKSYLAGKHRRLLEGKRKGLFEKYLPEIANNLSLLSGEKDADIRKYLEKLLSKGVIEESENGESEGEIESAGEESS